MALPPKAIEQLGREPVRTPGWSSGILLFTGALFFLSFAIYAGIAFGYKPFLNSRLSNVKNEISTFSSKIPTDQQEKLIQFHSQLKNLEALLREQKIGSAVFAWIEKNTHPNVYFSSVSVSLEEDQVNLSAKGKTLDDVVRQVAWLEARSEVVDTGFKGASRDRDDQWTFSLVLQFKPKFFSGSKAGN